MTLPHVSPVTLLQIAAVLLLAAAAGGVLLHGQAGRSDRIAARCRAVSQRRTRSGRLKTKPGSTRLLHLIGSVGTQVMRTGLLSDNTIKALRASLSSAGLRPDSALGLFVGSKVLLLAALPFLAWVVATDLDVDGMTRNIMLAVGAACGLLAPDFFIKRMRSSYLKKVERGLPDALDMLIICTEAGMSIEPAVQRVGQELRFAHPATADELGQTSNELQITGDPKRAFTALGTRTGIEGLRRLGITVVQTIEYGTPLSQALRILAGELRAEMINRFEEKAAQLPVTLTVPMIIFILPALFLIIGGPAAIQVMALQQ